MKGFSMSQVQINLIAEKELTLLGKKIVTETLQFIQIDERGNITAFGVDEEVTVTELAVYKSSKKGLSREVLNYKEEES